MNSGASSLKLTLLDQEDDIVDEAKLERWDGEADAVAEKLADFDKAEAVGHRVVHGGRRFRRPVVIDAAVEEQIAALTPLAPLHQPRALAGIRAVRSAWPDVPAVACFDTAFHADLPAAAATYAVPEQWNTRWGLRRFGFHGLSHAYAARRAAEMLGQPADQLRIVSCHLGAGASLCASLGERSLDTTMGYTPLEGLVMSTRSGSVDPGLVLWLVTDAGLTADEVRESLETSAGLAGITGGSGDMRDVLAGMQAGDTRAVLAFDIYALRLAKEIAAMTVALRGLEALVFTGGVGERAPRVRAAAAERLAHLGVAIDSGRNADAEPDADITASDATVRTLVIGAREDLEVARGVRTALQD